MCRRWTWATWGRWVVCQLLLLPLVFQRPLRVRCCRQAVIRLDHRAISFRHRQHISRPMFRLREWLWILQVGHCLFHVLYVCAGALRAWSPATAFPRRLGLGWSRTPRLLPVSSASPSMDHEHGTVCQPILGHQIWLCAPSSVISRPTCFSSSLRCCLQVGSAPFVRCRCDCSVSSAPFTNIQTYLLTYLHWPPPSRLCFRFGCLLAGLHRNYTTSFHKIWWKDGTRTVEEPIGLWW